MEAQQSLVDVMVVLLLMYAVTGLEVVVVLRGLEVLRATGLACVVVLVLDVEETR